MKVSTLVTQTVLLSSMQRQQGSEERNYLISFFPQSFLFLHVMHKTELIPCLTLTWQILLTLLIIVSRNICYIQVKFLYVCVSRVIKCLIFFHDLFAPYLRHRGQNQSTKRNHLLLCVHHCNPKEHLALSEFLNSTGQAHAHLAVRWLAPSFVPS